MSPACRICQWCLDHSEKGRAYRALWGEPEPPTFMSKALSFIPSFFSHLALGLPAADEGEKGRRLSICRGCPEYVDGASPSCRKCGCHLETKAGWLDQRCPLGRWEAPGGVVGKEEDV